MALFYPKVVIDGWEESGALKMIPTIYLDQKIGLIVEIERVKIFQQLVATNIFRHLFKKSKFLTMPVSGVGKIKSNTDDPLPQLDVLSSNWIGIGPRTENTRLVLPSS